MKLKLFVLAASLTGLIACGSTPVVKPDPKPDPKPEPQPETGASSEVSGQIIGSVPLHWPNGRTGTFRTFISRSDASAPTKFLHAVIAQGSIDAQGKLTAKLVDTPTVPFLKPYEICGIKTGANGIEAEFDVAEPGFETDAFKRAAILGQVNDNAQVLRIYVDRNVEIDDKCLDGQVSAKLSLKKGWNLVLTTFTQPGSTGAVYSSATGVAGVPFQIKLKLGSSWN
jgi:hypothetical protein